MRLPALTVLVALALAASSASPAARSSKLVAFQSCGDLLGYVKSQASRYVGPYGLGSPQLPGVVTRSAAPQQGVDYSGTNVQEEGVDEPDMVKTNGTTLFAVANGMLNALDVSTRKPRLLDSLKLDGGWSHELLLRGDRLLVLTRGGYWLEPLPGIAARIAPWAPSSSVLAEIDVSNPKALELVKTMTLDGSYVAARLLGHSARIVVSSQIPRELPWQRPTDSSAGALSAATAKNRTVIAGSGVASWLPTYSLNGKARPLVQCRRVARPPSFSGLGLLTVLTIDLDKGLAPVDSTSVMTDGRVVYASPQNLYVATERWAARPDPASPNVEPSGVTTEVHRFDISNPLHTQYRGSGSVSGYLLSQWSLSEYRGVLRVVSTEAPAWWGGSGDSESSLTTLRLQDGGLQQIGRVGGLGKGERVYAVRFFDDVGYVVTFRQVDPLYTLDLANPARPRVLGELTLPGYSAYLHGIGDNLVLGLGQDVNDQGRPQGTQLSIFDVSNLRQPSRIAHASLGAGWSEAEYEPHAFLYWPKTKLVVVPFQQQAVGFRVGRGVQEVGRIDHANGIRRSVVVRDSLLTVSGDGVESSSLATLAPQGWAAFPPG